HLVAAERVPRHHDDFREQRPTHLFLRGLRPADPRRRRSRGPHDPHSAPPAHSRCSFAHVYSRLSASIGSRLAARIAGYMPKNSPTMAGIETPSGTEQTPTNALKG